MATIGQQIAPFLKELQDNISKKNTYYGNRISKSIMDLFEVEVRQDGAGLLVPYWLGVTQRGRGPWLGTNIGKPLLRKIIYKWMEKRGLFKSATAAGKLGEAFVIARYINKHGNKQFQNHVYIDIYDTERERTIKKIDNQFALMIDKITKEVI